MARDIDASEIKCILYDFDGVMTDNRVLVDQNGIEAVFVNRGDGYAVARIRDKGINQAIISTEKNSVVERRAEKLGIPIIHGVDDKGSIVRQYCKENNINLSTVLFIGNDLNDLSAFDVVGYTGAPADAEKEILLRADWVSKKKGGYGAVRDLYGSLFR